MHNVISPTRKLPLTVMILISCLATMAVVINSILASAGISFKNKSECREYVMDGAKVVRNHAIQSEQTTSRKIMR
jgi:hypothetical protein